MAIRQKLQTLRRRGARHVLRHKLGPTGEWWRGIFNAFERIGLHVLPVHYYSPVPDTRELRKHVDRWFFQSELPGWDLRTDQQLELLRQLKLDQERSGEVASFEAVTASGFGQGYGETEAHVLAAMIYHFRPQRIIEVGAGVSTLYSLNALEANKQGDLFCIEPYPFDALRQHASGRLNLDVRKVQSVPIARFRELERNDILFIDSSHVSQIGSDVNYLVLEVLPRLKPGVLVHIHDIYLPLPCPPNYEKWIFADHFFWNESALLQAFLCFNAGYQVRLACAYLHHHFPQQLREAFSVYDPGRHYPSSLWIQRVDEDGRAGSV